MRLPVIFGGVLGATLVLLLVFPILALALAVTPGELLAATSHPLFWPALWLSLKTTLISLAAILILGTPLAWWLASSKHWVARVVGLLIELPIMIPPAVIGVALLMTFGRQGLLGGALEALGVQVIFTTGAVVLAQIVVSAPLYVRAAASAFSGVDEELLIVARSLGASQLQAIRRIALPMALPGLLTGASLAWARALGEFGATLLFAGNMSGKTQTMPLAIFSALEVDVKLAVVFSLVLTVAGGLLLTGLRLAKTRSSSHEPRGFL